MRLLARQFLTYLVILFIIGGLRANDVKPYPEPASCESHKDCLKGKAKCIRRECHCTGDYDFGDGKTQCDRWKECKFKRMCSLWSIKNKNTICLEHPNSNKTRTCKCKSGYFGRGSHPSCMKAAKENGKYPCLTNKNCPKYSKCHGGWCKCADELTGDGENCKPASPTKCTADKPTCRSKQGRCVQGFCSCIGLYAGDGRYCREASPCPKHLKCGAGICMIDPLYPNTPKCVCDQGATKTKDGKCVVVQCHSNNDCEKTYSICVEAQCTCKDELILGKKSCEPAPLHACDDDNDCSPQAKCQEGKCICQGNTTGNGKYCRDSLPCRMNCGQGGTCLKEPLLPEHPPVCRCDKGFIKRKDGKCVAPAHPCKKNKDCHEKAECHRGTCRCIGETTGNGKNCRDSLPCPKEYVEKCKAAGRNVVSCVVDPLFPDQPECKCHLDFKTSEAGICVEMTECEKNDLVCPTGKVCKTNKGDYLCACKDGYEEILHGAENTTCKDIDECSQNACSDIDNSVCTNIEGSYKCECKAGFRKSADQNTCEAAANQICQEGVCKCSPGFAKNSDEECIDVDECYQDETPCGANEECLNDQGTYYCVCRSGYMKKNKVCAKKDACDCKRDEVCLKGKCKCKKGYKKSTKGYCVRRRRAQAGLGLSLHGNGFLSTFLLGVISTWPSQNT